ncbi:S8 family peptidase [Virgisporangium aurantiacum]|uniref:Peptidase S8/S53 domain-containing protein n=1 Tax=Virgisporangium aurantiacum TaxID=175570 RepID=A0A8J3Z830_9ACTN|nr:S8/S53 family peptidase [Virgisporangium aurantiacum]GIJ56946.1 hypothetical protein Vau01_044620 [Virgisporangium aurantiacum]
MNLNDPEKGHPFTNDYPNAPDTDKYRAAVKTQIEKLNGGLASPADRNKIVKKILASRANHPGLDPITEFGPDPNPKLLHVTGEILINRDALTSAAVAQAIADNALQRSTVEHDRLSGLVACYRNRALASEKLQQVVRQLRAQNVPAALNYVVSTAAVGKSDETPEPVQGLGHFSAYPVPSRTGGFPVGIVDTGITSEVRTDGWLAGVADPPSEIDPLDVLPPTDRLDAAAGHGTHVSGIVQQVAPGVTIRVFKALATDGCGSDLAAALAILRAVDAGCKILNLSFGCTLDGGPPPMAMAAALALIPNDVLIVAAAGNGGDEVKVYPAAFAEQSTRVVSVAGLQADLTGAGWSTHGTWVKASTIAEGVRSTFVKGTEWEELENPPDVYPGSSWALWSGTSFAVPQIVGAVARICQEFAGTTPVQAWQLLRATGIDVAGYGRAVKVLSTVP